MEALLVFFEQMPTWQKLAWVMTCLALSWILEGSLPLVQLRYRKWGHAGANFAFPPRRAVATRDRAPAASSSTKWQSCVVLAMNTPDGEAHSMAASCT